MKSPLYVLRILLLLLPLWSNAQVFPVQATPQLIPPYSLRLSAYNTSSTEKLLLNLLLTDISESSRQVRLKLYIENNGGIAIQSTDVVAGANPIFLDGGLPLRLSNVDLQPYFLLQNLQGISPQQYSVSLPEGFYRFCFEVYDVQSGKQISRKSCVPVYLVLNDPPFLNIPQNGEHVVVKEPQNIIFQWTPRHLNATNVSYEFTLTELWDTQMDPQAAFLAGRPLFQTTTFATTLLYGPADTPLLADKMYGWRVRAMINDGISQNAIFKNDGYSEIHYFTHSDHCVAPEAVFTEAKNTTTEKIFWTGVDHIGYEVQYRKKATENKAGQPNMWFHEGTANAYTTIYKLEPGLTYEFRVGGQCLDNGPYTYSQIYEFIMPDNNRDTATYNCGITPELVITNQEPLTQIITNEIFTAGDFPVTVKEIVAGNVRNLLPEDKTEEEIKQEEEDRRGATQAKESSDGLGIYSGWGFIEVPYLNDAKIKVSFEGIKINTDYQLIEGIVQTDYDQNWGGVASVNDVLDLFEGANDLVNIQLNYDITKGDIGIAGDGQIVITNPKSGLTTKYPGGDDVIIMDTNEDGTRDIFHVDADGNVREGGQLAPGGAINPQRTAGVDSNGEVLELTAKGIQVTFVDDPNYSYGFDALPPGQEQVLDTHYKKIKDASGDNWYPIINKAVGNGATEAIKAVVSITDPKVALTDLVMKTVHGELVPYQVLDAATGSIRLELKGYYAFEHQNIYATIQPQENSAEKETIAGVFSQWHLADKEVSLTIIPVANTALPTAEQLETKINAIFNKASVRFRVTVAPQMNVGMATVAVGDSGLTSNYTDSQKKIITQFQQLRKTDPKSYYVFVLGKNVRPSRSVAGFMPLQRQFGFVFTSNLSDTEEGKNSLEATLAHELGHGAFALEHPFSELQTTQGATGWLLDYGSGTKFSHLDWSQIHNPEFKLYFFQDDLDGALTVAALTPSGMKLEYTGDGAIAFTNQIPEYSNGAVFAITENGVRYDWQKNRYNTNGAYLHQDKKLPNAEVSYLSRSDTSPLQLYWNKGSCDQNEIYSTTVNIIYPHILPQDPTNPARVALSLNDERYEGISLLGKAGCSNDAFCGNIALLDLEPEVQELIRISNAITASREVPSAAMIAQNVVDLSVCGLRTLEYQVVKTLLMRIWAQRSFNDNKTSEEAIVKLLLCISSSKYSDFSSAIAEARNMEALDRVIGSMTNHNFQGLSEAGENTFLTVLTQLVAGSENTAAKWKVFNSVGRVKRNQLLEEAIAAVQLGILQSLPWRDEAERQTIPAVYTLFVAMLSDPHLPVLQEYKVVFDIAKLRYDAKQKFAKFTMTEFITLRMRNLNDMLLEPEVRQVYDLALIPDVSWVFPIPSERFGVLMPKVEAQDLHRNFAWSRHLRDTGATLEQLEQGPKAFLNTFYEQLLVHMDASNQGNADFWNTISSITCDTIIDIITHINLNENASSLQDVAPSIKKQALRAYFDCEHTIRMDDRTQLVEGAESSLRKLLSSFAPSDSSILETIEDIGFEKIDRMLSNTAFYEFILWVGMQISSSNSGIPMEKLDGVISIEADGLVVVDPDPLLQLEADIFQRQNFSGDLTGNVIKIAGTSYLYNQIVPIHIRGSFDFLGKRYKRGDVLFIPVIQAYAMSESNQSIVVWNSAFLAADVVSFAVPFVGGSIRLMRVSGHLVSKAIMASDIAASGASALVTALNADAIDPDLRFKIQMASLATSVPSVFKGLPNDLDDLIRQADAGVDAARISDPDRRLLKSAYGGGGMVSDFVTRLQGDISNFYTAIVRAGYRIEVMADHVKVFAKNNMDLLAEIYERSIRIKYQGWGGDIITRSDRTTTCIAKFDDQFDRPGSQFIKEELPEGSFGRGTSNRGGINILDVDDATYLRLEDEATDILTARGGSFTINDVREEANEIFWNRYNLPFLEEAFRRGDDIRLLSDPDTLFGYTGFYKREIQVITQGWTRTDGSTVPSLQTRYNYRYNGSTHTYEKID